jgi:hypothetical protein
VLVTLDLVGIDRRLAGAICRDLQKKHGLPRAAILLSVSHTHTGPLVLGNLDAMYNLDKTQREHVTAYARSLHESVLKVAGEALGRLAPARLSWGVGKATFAVNRRENKEPDVPKLRAAGKLKGPVDHDVPVLAVRDAEGALRAVVFGYACHATVLSFYKWSGDYPGFAQLELEKMQPGAVALFWAGCGGDQNPLPRRSVQFAEGYGLRLANAVEDVLGAPMTPVAGRLGMAYAEVELPFAGLPTREQLLKDALSENKYVAARAKLLLEQVEATGSLRGVYPYPVQAWQLGPELTWVALGGEVVVDYAVRLKKELGPGRTWVAAYANDVMAYIPSLRVLKEGGYEGGGAMLYYGLPAVWGPRVEELIVAAAHEQVGRARVAAKAE